MKFIAIIALAVCMTGCATLPKGNKCVEYRKVYVPAQDVPRATMVTTGSNPSSIMTYEHVPARTTEVCSKWLKG